MANEVPLQQARPQALDWAGHFAVSRMARTQCCSRMRATFIGYTGADLMVACPADDADLPVVMTADGPV